MSRILSALLPLPLPHLLQRLLPACLHLPHRPPEPAAAACAPPAAEQRRDVDELEADLAVCRRQLAAQRRATERALHHSSSLSAQLQRLAETYDRLAEVHDAREAAVAVHGVCDPPADARLGSTWCCPDCGSVWMATGLDVEWLEDGLTTDPHGNSGPAACSELRWYALEYAKLVAFAIADGPDPALEGVLGDEAHQALAALEEGRLLLLDISAAIDDQERHDGRW